MFVSRIEFIRSKLSIFSAHVYVVRVPVESVSRYGPDRAGRTEWTKTKLKLALNFFKLLSSVFSLLSVVRKCHSKVLNRKSAGRHNT